MATGALNQGLFSRLGAELPSGYIDLLIGNRTGTLGELSGLLILAASVFIISRKFIRWQIPASMIGSFTLLVWIFGGLPFGRGFLAGDVLFALLNGSLLLVAFFMAPDPVTSPSSRWGMLAFGFGAGSLTFLLRQFGSSSEGTTFAVLIMNCFTPLLDRPRGLGRRGAPQET
jgi:electron transport complex protein RnfD